MKIINAARYKVIPLFSENNSDPPMIENIVTINEKTAINKDTI